MKRITIWTDEDGAKAVDQALHDLDSSLDYQIDDGGWDGEWRTLFQTEDEARKALMTWSKAQLVSRILADGQRKVQNQNWVADRLTAMTAERDALLGREAYPPMPNKPLRTLYTRRTR